MNIDNIRAKASQIYQAKVRTGLYDHYPPKALDLLWEDCVRQAEMMVETEENGTNNRNIGFSIARRK